MSGLKMWSRLSFFVLFYFAAVSCAFESDKVFGQVKNLGSRSQGDHEGSYGQDGQTGVHADSSTYRSQGGGDERQSFSSTQESPGYSGNLESTTSKYNEKNSFGRPESQKFNNMQKPIPSTGFIQSSNNNNNNAHSSGGFDTINSEHSSNRPLGGSSHTSFNQSPNFGSHGSGGDLLSRPTGESTHSSNHPSSFGPSSSGDNSFGQPTEQSFHSSNNREDNNRPSGSRPSSSGGSSFGRPTGESTHSSNHPSSFGPSSSGDNSFGQPTEQSFHSSNNREDNNRPSGSRPSSSGGSSFGRPTGESTHSSNHPSSFGPSSSEGNSFGQSTGQSTHTSNNRPSSSKPISSGNNSIGRPSGESTHSSNNRPSEFTSASEEQFGRPSEQSNQNQHTGGEIYNPDSGHQVTNEETAFSNHSGNENDNQGKEEDKDVCFPRLGCFKMGKPWKSVLRPIGPPHGPEKIQTTIHFYSRENLEKQRNITVYPEINMGEARFDPRKISVMIVHGFSNSGNATWMKDMKNVYLKKVDANVMIVDWGRGAQLINYLQVAGNTRVVGKQLGLFVKYLIENFGADPGKFHLIGHSLGAQICSYLAKEVPGIARLTALDPAQPGFEGFNREVRLDKTDAEFVDVIHTDARPFIPTLGFGMIAPHGHVDFYMNGGYDQPGCVPPSKKELPSIKSFLDLAKYPVEVIAKTVACPHARAYEYLIESFNETENCIFWGHKADVKNVFKSVTNTVTQGLLKKLTALSPTCSKEDCIPVGFATKKSPLRGSFVVTTNNRMPYCISEPGVPPETPPQERKQESFIQKIGKKTGILG